MIRTVLRMSVSSIGLLVAAACFSCIALGASSREATTHIYNQQGKHVGAVVGGPTEDWTFGASGECWLTQGSRRIFAALTHTYVGAAVPSSLGRWKVWRGHRLQGTLVRQSTRRWNLYSRGGSFVGYTIGRDGLAAGTARLVFGHCL
jgi:hypothetical protein